MKKTIYKIIKLTHIILTSVLILLLWVSFNSDQKTKNLIAVSWGDGLLGKASYGVYIYAIPTGKGEEVGVSGVIYIGKSDSIISLIYDIEKIGTAENFAAAVKKWGTVTWSEKEVIFGEKGKAPYAIPKEKFQSWR